ncbi:hypothetical protein EDD21DRAFT_41714 [Dissophora ornata]|nr:hypothetical protein EDD21DRAFT_41714 [Dissophora ornata]
MHALHVNCPISVQAFVVHKLLCLIVHDSWLQGREGESCKIGVIRDTKFIVAVLLFSFSGLLAVLLPSLFSEWWNGWYVAGSMLVRWSVWNCPLLLGRALARAREDRTGATHCMGELSPTGKVPVSVTENMIIQFYFSKAVKFFHGQPVCRS